jgi:hypothetical protein
LSKFSNSNSLGVFAWMYSTIISTCLEGSNRLDRMVHMCWSLGDFLKVEYMLNVYLSQLNRQAGSRNLTGQKTLPTKWGTYMKRVTKYQISAINICWEKCDEKWAYMFNLYKNQQSRQTGSRNLMGSKTLPHDMGYRYEACDQISDLCHQ